MYRIFSSHPYFLSIAHVASVELLLHPVVHITSSVDLSLDLEFLSDYITLLANFTILHLISHVFRGEFVCCGLKEKLFVTQRHFRQVCKCSAFLWNLKKQLTACEAGQESVASCVNSVWNVFLFCR